MNFFIKETRKNLQLIMNQFSINDDKLNQNIKINVNEKKVLKSLNGKYIGQVVNGFPEGKGIEYWNNGDRYEGDFKNGVSDGKGIYYCNSEPFKGDRYEGDFKNGQPKGKEIMYYHNRDRYEGDFKKWKKEGKGIYYAHNVDREMGDFYNDMPKGKCIRLTREGEVKINTY